MAKLIVSWYESITVMFNNFQLVSPHDPWCSTTLTNVLAWVCPILRCMPIVYTMVYKLIKTCTQVTLGISMLTNIFLNNTKMLNNILTLHNKMWKVPIVCSTISCPYIRKCKTIISCIPICYAKCHNINMP